MANGKNSATIENLRIKPFIITYLSNVELWGLLDAWHGYSQGILLSTSFSESREACELTKNSYDHESQKFGILGYFVRVILPSCGPSKSLGYGTDKDTFIGEADSDQATENAHLHENIE